MQGDGRAGLTIKAALLLGFGLTLGLWLWAWYDFTARMAEVERDAAAINVRYMRAQELLASVRPEVLLASVTVRSALLDPDPAKRPEYRARIEGTLRSVDDALQKYVPVVNSAAERDRVERLRREIDGFGTAILEVMSADPARTVAEAGAQLARVVPRRELVIGVTDEVQALNRSAFVAQQRALAEAHGAAERRVWTRFDLSVAASLAIGLLATLYVTRLEGRLRRQRETEARNARDLQRLSARLVRAQEEERRTIARELHDEVGQVLTTIKVELALAQRRLEEAGGSGHVLDDAQSIADGALNTVRDLSHLLHPALLDDLGLAAAIDWYLEAFGRRHGVRVELVQEGLAERLGPEIEIAAYRIVQEALTNAAKHARARSITVTLRRGPSALSIGVADDGIGFDASALESGGVRTGLGLLGARERVTHLRGTLRIDSAPCRGTRVTAELPVIARPVDDSAAPFDATAAEPTPEGLAG